MTIPMRRRSAPTEEISMEAWWKGEIPLTREDKRLLDNLHEAYGATPEGLSDFLVELQEQRPDCVFADVTDDPHRPAGEMIPHVDGKGNVDFYLNLPKTSDA